MFQLADAYAEREPNGTYSNLFDANIAVNCADQKTVPDVDQVRSLQGQWRSSIPLFGAPLAVGMLTCAVWPGGHDPYPTGPATGSPPILVVGTTGDPATPYAQAPALANMLGVGRLLTWEGEGHTAYPQTSCVTQAVDAYLLNLTVPPEGKRCPPQVIPSRAASSSSSRRTSRRLFLSSSCSSCRNASLSTISRLAKCAVISGITRSTMVEISTIAIARACQVSGEMSP